MNATDTLQAAATAALECVLALAYIGAELGDDTAADALSQLAHA